MKTIALRFGEHFSPECGTIAAHQEIIDKLGYVWYGKLGSPVNQKMIAELKQNEDSKFLLINSGKSDRYWAHIADVSTEIPPYEEFPAYYHELADKMRTWFKVISFEPAEKRIMAKCFVASSGSPLTEASKHSMSPYFIINYEEGG